MKCSACEKKECKWKHKNRRICKSDEERIKCSCTCQVSSGETFASSAISIGAGVAAAAGGITLTVMTGGLFAFLGGATLVSTGSALVKNPIKKKLTGEYMTLKDTAKNVALGASIGAITGPLGAGGSAIAKGASGAMKFGAKRITGKICEKMTEASVARKLKKTKKKTMIDKEQETNKDESELILGEIREDKMSLHIEDDSDLILKEKMEEEMSRNIYFEENSMELEEFSRCSHSLLKKKKKSDLVSISCIFLACVGVAVSWRFQQGKIWRFKK